MKHSGIKKIMLLLLFGALFAPISCASLQNGKKDNIGIALKKEAIEEKAAYKEMQYRRNKSMPPDYVSLARTLVEGGFYDVALNQLQAAEALDGKNPEIFYLKGICLREKKEYEVARIQLERALGISPDHAYAHAGLGTVHELSGEHEKAIACYARAIALDPGIASFYNNLGVSYMAEGVYEKAAACFENGLALDPDSIRTLNNLGLAYGMLGKDQEAFELFKRMGGEAVAWNNLGYVRQMRGERARAAEMYRRALTADPGYGAAKTNLKTLGEGEGGVSHGMTDEELTPNRRNILIDMEEQ